MSVVEDFAVVEGAGSAGPAAGETSVVGAPVLEAVAVEKLAEIADVGTPAGARPGVEALAGKLALEIPSAG
ncbi:hypothetical protein [Dactylosporangium sp. NPDC051541]|uniref:hypothetical protein n=1 Tax=Dactylosporangium sp. NPDC051541 TaxID=3363977 RepID=UPI0037A4DCDB